MRSVAVARAQEACSEPKEKYRRTETVSERTMDGPTSCCSPVSGSIFANSWELVTRASVILKSVRLISFLNTN